ncbi:MAG: hypothetical protein Q4A29_08910 [Eubacteriales bacterium]|nr:hypothetical protein [Eubacteriales bacterium]
MDQNIQKALWLGVGILLFIGIVSTGLTLYNKGRGVAEASSQQLDKVSKDLAESTYASYNNTTTSGADVISAIKLYADQSGDFIVQVQTNTGNKTYISNGSISNNTVDKLSSLTRSAIDAQIKEANDSKGSSYINPTAKFYAQLIYDKNEVIKGITFKQE